MLMLMHLAVQTKDAGVHATRTVAVCWRFQLTVSFAPLHLAVNKLHSKLRSLSEVSDPFLSLRNDEDQEEGLIKHM